MPRFPGLSAIYGLGLVALLLISGVATWQGLRDFVQGLSIESGALPSDRAELWIREGLVAFLVFTFTILMWLALESVRRHGHPLSRLGYTILYVFLVIWSVGFGFGFWWKYLVSGTTSAAQVETSFRVVEQEILSQQSALSQVRARIANAAARSETMSAREAAFGNTCEGKPSAPGAGDLTRNRRKLSDDFRLLSQRISTDWIREVESDYGEISRRLRAFRAQPPALSDSEDARRQAYTELGNSIESAARTINETTRRALRETLGGLARLEDYVSRPATGPTLSVGNWDDPSGYICNDRELAERISSARDIVLESRPFVVCPFEFKEGAEATAFAVIRLWSIVLTPITGFSDLVPGGSLGLGSSDLGSSAPGSTPGVPTTAERRVLDLFQSEAVAQRREQRCGRQARIGDFGNRDLIALFAALGVDLGILILTLGQPRPPRARVPMDKRTERDAFQREVADIVDASNLADDPGFERFVKDSFLAVGRDYYVVILHLSLFHTEDQTIIGYTRALQLIEGILRLFDVGREDRVTPDLEPVVLRKMHFLLNEYAGFEPRHEETASDVMLVRVSPLPYFWMIKVLGDMAKARSQTDTPQELDPAPEIQHAKAAEEPGPSQQDRSDQKPSAPKPQPFEEALKDIFNPDKSDSDRTS